MRTRILVKDGRDRMIFDTLRLIKDERNASHIARLAGVCPGTVLNLRKDIKHGGTRRPTCLTLAKIGAAFGADLRFVPRGFKVPEISHDRQER